MFCRICGNELNGTETFCGKCGTKVFKVMPPKEMEQEAVTQDSKEAASEENKEMVVTAIVPVKEASRKKKYFIGAACAVVAVVAVVAAIGIEDRVQGNPQPYEGVAMEGSVSVEETSSKETSTEETSIEESFKYPIDVTNQFGEAEKNLLESYTSAFVYTCGWNESMDASSEEVADEDKAFMTYISMYMGDFRERNTFETAGLLTEDVFEGSYDSNSYRVTLEHYEKIIDSIWQGGFSGSGYSQQYFEELHEVYSESIAEDAIICGDGTYRLFQWGDGEIGVTIQDMEIIQTSETTYQIVIEAEENYDFMDDESFGGVYYSVVLDTVANSESPFAGMTITHVQLDMN